MPGLYFYKCKNHSTECSCRDAQYAKNHGNKKQHYYQVYDITSAKIIQVNEWGCRNGMHHAKNRGNKEIPLAILSRILAQSFVTPWP